MEAKTDFLQLPESVKNAALAIERLRRPFDIVEYSERFSPQG